MKTVTVRELEVLNTIKNLQNEQGHSEFLSTDAETKSVAGIVSSLSQKGLIYDAYSNWTLEDFADQGDKPFKMWCITSKGVQIVGRPTEWEAD